jgi:hypothetical protein
MFRLAVGWRVRLPNQLALKPWLATNKQGGAPRPLLIFPPLIPLATERRL